MAVGDAHVFLDFLTPVLTQLSFQSYWLLFWHASAEVRIRQKNVRLNRVSNSQPSGHESDTLTTEPPGRAQDERGHQVLFHEIEIVYMTIFINIDRMAE